MDDSKLEERRKKVLILKTGYSELLDHRFDMNSSLGDVFRTTPLLHAYKEYHVTWVTDPKAFPLLRNNPFIDRLLPLDWLTAKQLSREDFDVFINLEKHLGICVLASEISALTRYGFGFRNGEYGLSIRAHDMATEALDISTKPGTKKTNEKTIQDLLFEVVGKKWNGEEYVLGYKPKSKQIYDVGLNTLVGTKWPTKAWPNYCWDTLESLFEMEGLKITRQDKVGREVLEDLDTYMDWINSSKVIVTNDSLGMHLAIALKKKVLGLFGPTPVTEVYFYNCGKGIRPEDKYGCMPCMSTSCEAPYKTTCLRAVEPREVFSETMKLLGTK
ncbi:glycosyltransferase family 9 protein [Candidatus Woesearchaeota archaeon]|nr:glycosyltransferase family 9 protein [Candidatus Woesearchaeota archaeon]